MSLGYVKDGKYIETARMAHTLESMNPNERVVANQVIGIDIASGPIQRWANTISTTGTDDWAVGYVGTAGEWVVPFVPKQDGWLVTTITKRLLAWAPTIRIDGVEVAKMDTRLTVQQNGYHASRTVRIPVKAGAKIEVLISPKNTDGYKPGEAWSAYDVKLYGYLIDTEA